jgi:tyrosyl-tRNA synthetase
MNRNVLDVLYERGFVKDISSEENLRRLLDQPTSVYFGCDATASSFHVGNQVGMMALAWFQRCGHRPIIVMGGGTTMVGDPSGRSSERPMLSPSEIDTNVRRLRRQFARFVDFDRGASQVDNADWLVALNLVEFLRDVGSKFSVNQMLAHETYKVRLDAGGLTMLELSYQLLQAYDFLHLYRTDGCRLQIGGSDQWANILAGVDLIRKSESAQAFALVWPLITTSSGAKMGKTAARAVWMDREQLSPYEYYQFWINTEDADVERFLALFTFLPMHEVQRLASLQGADLRSAKETLAFEVTAIVHGQDEAERARAASRVLFGTVNAEPEPTHALPAERFAMGLGLIDLVVEIGLISSKREARRLLEQGGLSLNGQTISSDRPVTSEDLSGKGRLTIRAGKKRHAAIQAE